MSNIRILYNFLFDDATITSSSEVSGLPDDNAVHEFVRKVWRTTVDTGQWITFDLGSAQQITMLAIFGYNFTSGATLTLKANSTNAWTSPAFSTALTWHEQAIVVFIDQNYRWWRIEIDDAANLDGYIEIGRICAGAYYEPGVNINQDFRKTFHDPSVRQVSDGRQGYCIERELYRTFEVFFSGIDRTQQGELETIFRAAKTIRPVVFALDPDTHPSDDTAYCRISTPLSETLGTLGNGDVSLSLEELVS